MWAISAEKRPTIKPSTGQQICVFISYAQKHPLNAVRAALGLYLHTFFLYTSSECLSLSLSFSLSLSLSLSRSTFALIKTEKSNTFRIAFRVAVGLSG